MANRWSYKKIEDIAVKVGMGPFGSSIKVETFVPAGIPIVSGQHLHGFRLDEDAGFNFISEEHADVLKNANVFRGDVIFTHAGNIENIAYIPENSKYERYVASQRQFYMRCDLNQVLPSWIVYYFKSHEGKYKLTANSSSVGVPSIAQPVSYLRKVEIPVPPLPEQHAIVGILNTLGDKIELNRRMIRTLESMAWEVYKEMMKDAGGEEKTIGDVTTVVGGSTPSTTNPAFWENGDIHWATPKDLAPLESPVLLDTNSQISELGLQEISSGLLPVGTVLLSSRAPIGYLAITQIPVAINQGFIAIKCTENTPNYFVLNWLKDNMEEIIGRANGTTFLEISKSNFRPMKIVVPSPEKMKKFVATVESLYHKIISNLIESSTLESLRETLLPKLMVGKARVRIA